MASGSHRMPANPHIVGGIEESRIDTRPVADDPLQKTGIAAVATSNPVLAENPDIAWLCPWRYREGRDDLIVGIGAPACSLLIGPSSVTSPVASSMRTSSGWG